MEKRNILQSARQATWDFLVEKHQHEALSGAG